MTYKNINMRLSLFTLMLSLTSICYAQDNTVVSTSEKYPNTFSSGSKNVYKFDNKARKFKDWGVSVGGGGAFINRADLTSFYDGKIRTGWNAYVSLDKQISHTFGLSLNYTLGQTKQAGKVLPFVPSYVYSWVGNYQDATQPELRGVGEANTKYHILALLGDLNLTNLLRRVDNRSPYRWAFHGYAGLV